MAPGSTDRSRGRFIAGDPLRGIAAPGVFGIHAVGAAVAASNFGGHASSPLVFVVLYGWPGWVVYGLNSFVGLFFVLSGYLLSRPYLRSILIDAPRPSVRRYLRNRGLRILPPFWTVLAIVLIVYGTRGLSASKVLGLATFTQTWGASPFHDVFGQAWSLNVEVRYYLLLPVCGIALLGLRWSGLNPRWRLLVLRDRIAFPWEELVGDAGAAGMVGGALPYQWTTGRSWRIIDLRALREVGARSYPLFLIHTIVLDKLTGPLHIGGYRVTLALLAPAALVVSLVASGLLHRFVELPLDIAQGPQDHCGLAL